MDSLRVPAAVAATSKTHTWGDWLLIGLAGWGLLVTFSFLALLLMPEAAAKDSDDMYLEFLELRECVVADVRDGNTRLYRCNWPEQGEYLTPGALRQELEEHRGTESRESAV